MPVFETENLIRELKELRRIATFDGTYFKDQELKLKFLESTKTYRESWLIAPLDRLIYRYESALHEQGKKNKKWRPKAPTPPKK